jgi:predicted secreted protein
MSWFTSFILFVLIWWIALFAVLPLGVRPNADADQTTGWRGLPDKVRLGRIILITSLITLVVWGLAMAVILSPYLSFRTGFLALPQD